MRTRDIEIGETYQIEIPWQLPESRYPHPTTTVADVAAWWQLITLRGTRFALSVIGIDPTGARPTVDGIRSVTSTGAVVALTPEQCLQLGLPIGAYEIVGHLQTTAGDPVRLPEVQTLTVPTRWLHPLDEQRPPTHRDVDRTSW